MAYDKPKLPWSETDQTFWKQEIKDARQTRTNASDAYGWKENLERYVPAPVKTETGATNADVNIGADFRDVERKKAALLFEFPQIGLTVKQDREIMENGQTVVIQPNSPPLMLSTLVSWQANILNEILGPDHAHAEHAARKAIFNCLCPAGVGPVSVGYSVTMRKVKTQTPAMGPDGMPVLDQMMQPMMQDIEVEVPIDERWFVSDDSPNVLLIPASFRNTNFSKAPWIGKDFRKPLSQLRREYHLPEDWSPTASDEVKATIDLDRIQVEEDDAGDPYVTGVELYYHEQLRTDKEVHPDALIKLVIADGKEDDPLCHEPFSHQTFGENGELSPDSLRTAPMKPLVLRDLTDSAWVPSDCSVTAPLTKEINKYRSQIIENRNGNKQVIAFDAGKVDPTAKDKMVNAHGVAWVGIAEGGMGQGLDAIIKQVAQPTLGRETYIGQDYIEKDRERILGMADNQSGVQSKGKKTATEQTIVQRNSEARFEQERQRVNAWVIQVATAIDVLILRYADERIAIQILGDVRGKVWAQYKHHLLGGYGYDLKIDSGKYMDIEADRRQVLQFYNMVRKDPFVNPLPILKEMALKFGYDPAELVAQPQKPDKELKASVSIKGENLDPNLPQFPIMIKLLRQGGWEISEEDVQLAQQQAMVQTGGMMPVAGVGQNPKQSTNRDHPGAQEKSDTLNQHQMDESGDRSGPKVM